MTVVLGAGLAGLSAGALLSRAGRKVRVIEKDPVPGGLARTVRQDGFSFDLGGHRFLTGNPGVGLFVGDLLKGELLRVNRKSKIFLRGRYFDYPLRPVNAVFGLGPATTCRILADYALQQLRRHPGGRIVSLRDWVVSRFGRTMFDIYFRQYSEKVWGISCDEISSEWVARRIKGLSLGRAVRNAFFRWSGRDIPTLADTFQYPETGIGRIAERLAEEIGKTSLSFDSRVTSILHDGSAVLAVEVGSGGKTETVEGPGFISTVPLTSLVRMLAPAPPDDVLAAARRLQYRDLLVVTVFLDCERVTDLTWLYLPERTIPFGRIHEPKNWSPAMAPPGKTHLVAEHFCFHGDQSWSSTDERLVSTTVSQLCRMGFVRKGEVTGAAVVRVPGAYPLLEVGYRSNLDRILRYLCRFRNLRIAGRGGSFQYLNMDHAISEGIKSAEAILSAESLHKDAALAFSA